MNENEPFRKYYSQHGEDYLLWNFFDYKKEGIFIEVGAFDGIHLSNSYSFEQAGWSGLCIEPSQYYEYCKKNRPNSVCLNLACVDSDDIDELTFYEEKLGLLSSLDIDEKKEKDIKLRYEKRGLQLKDINKYQVKCKTLNKILEENNIFDVDFISIDVEGAELSVLKGLSLSKYQPKVLIIEANDDNHKKELIEYLTVNNQYIFARQVNVNLFFVLDNIAADKLNSISINCTIQKQLHPLGEKFTLKSFLYGLTLRNGINVDLSTIQKQKTIEEKNTKLQQKADELIQKQNIIKVKNKELCTQTKKSEVIESKLNTITKELTQLTNIKFSSNPIQKYQAYKQMLHVYHTSTKQAYTSEEIFILPTDNLCNQPEKKFCISSEQHPIMIFQVGKVGSSTMAKSLKSVGTDLPVYQIHNIETAKKLLEKENALGYKGGFYHFTTGDTLKTVINQNPEIRWKVIVGVREPIKRWVSDIFQNINERYEHFYDNNGKLNQKELIKFVQETLETEPMQVWFDEELKTTFDIDIFEHSFEKTKGYTVIKADNADILVYKLENLKDSFSNMMKEFLSLELEHPESTNEAKNKVYAEDYKSVLQNLKFDKSYLKHFYAEPVTSHFYSDSEIESFIKLWKK